MHCVAKVGFERSLLITFSWSFFNVLLTIPWMGINFCKSGFRPRNVVFLFDDSYSCFELSKLRAFFCTRHVLLAFFSEKLAYLIRRRIFQKELGRHIGFYQSPPKFSHDRLRSSDDPHWITCDGLKGRQCPGTGLTGHAHSRKGEPISLLFLFKSLEVLSH